MEVAKVSYRPVYIHGFGPCIYLFKSPLLFSLKSNPKPVARREWAQDLPLDVVPAAGDGSCKHSGRLGKTQCVLLFSLTCLLIIYYYFFLSFPELKRHQVGNTGNRCSRTALSWVASAVLCIPKISQEQTHARRFPHQGLAQQ